MIAGTFTFIGATVVLLGADDLQSPTNSLLTAPEIVWELFISIYLTFKGFRPSPILLDDSPQEGSRGGGAASLDECGPPRVRGWGT